MVVLEALSVGTPAIGSNIGGLPEILNKVSPNLLFNNLSELKNILSNFSKNEYSPRKIKNIYEANFSPEAYMAKYFGAIATIRND